MKNILKKLMVYVTCAAIILVTYGNQAFAKDLQTFSNENFVVKIQILRLSIPKEMM